MEHGRRVSLDSVNELYVDVTKFKNMVRAFERDHGRKGLGHKAQASDAPTLVVNKLEKLNTTIHELVDVIHAAIGALLTRL